MVERIDLSGLIVPQNDAENAFVIFPQDAAVRVHRCGNKAGNFELPDELGEYARKHKARVLFGVINGTTFEVTHDLTRLHDKIKGGTNEE